MEVNFIKSLSRRNRQHLEQDFPSLLMQTVSLLAVLSDLELVLVLDPESVSDPGSVLDPELVLVSDPGD